MAAAVKVTNVAVMHNPAPFLHPFWFEITYECLEPLPEDMEWNFTYVGSAYDETYDQLLESVFVGPVNLGTYRFILQANPPDPSKIPGKDIIGETVVLLTCSYFGQEFVRIGYYVKNEYDDQHLRQQPPKRVLIDRVRKTILADRPRVTKFPINFHPETSQNSDEPASPSLSSTEPWPPDIPH